LGGSARDVYRAGNRLAQSERVARTIANKISKENIESVKLWQPYREDILPNIDPQYTHLLLSVYPCSDRDRREIEIRSPTQFTTSLLLDRYGKDRDSARSEMFKCFMEFTMGHGIAGDIYDLEYHGVVTKGGYWPVYEMERSTGPKNLIWKTSETLVGYVVADNRLSFMKTAPDLDHPFRRIDVKFFKKSELTGDNLQTGVWYRPKATNFATLDSFCIDRNGHAIILQPTVAEDHPVKEEGIKWLHSLGITSMTYVYLSPSTTTIDNFGTKKPPQAEIKWPKNQLCPFDHVYHMFLDFD
jgi:hypothetical protein